VNVQDITGGSTWAIAAAAFSNPMYLSGPLGKSDNSNSTGFQITPGAAVVIGFEGTYTGATVAHEQTMDPTGAGGWFSVEGSPSDGTAATSTGATTGTAYVFTCVGVQHRIKVTALSTGTIIVRIRLEGEAISTSGGGGGAAGDVNLTEVAGTAVTSGAGAVTAGTQRVTLASDDPAVVALEAMQDATGPVLIPSAGAPVKGLTAAMTGTASTAVTGMGAPGSGLYNYITAIVVGNSDTDTGTFVEFQDDNGGTTFFTVPANYGYGGVAIAFPTPLKQPTSNKPLYVKNTTTGANVIVSVVGYTGA
jgi:hypothetical protein